MATKDLGLHRAGGNHQILDAWQVQVLTMVEGVHRLGGMTLKDTGGSPGDCEMLDINIDLGLES